MTSSDEVDDDGIVEGTFAVTKKDEKGKVAHSVP